MLDSLAKLKVKIGIIILFVLFIFVLDIHLAVYIVGLYRFIPSVYVFGTNRTALSDVLFNQGVVIFIIGALVAAGASNLHIERFSSLYAYPSGHDRFVRENRKSQVSFGVVLVTVGAILMGLAITIGSLA